MFRDVVMNYILITIVTSSISFAIGSNVCQYAFEKEAIKERKAFYDENNNFKWRQDND